MNIATINFNQRKNPSFTSRADVVKVSRAFADALGERFSDKNSITFSELQKFVKKFMKEAKIRVLDKDKIAKMEGCCEENYLEKNNRMLFKGVFIWLKRRGKSETGRKKLLGDLVHEMTHAFWYKDKDTSDLSLSNRYLKNHTMDELKKHITLYNNIFDIELYTNRIKKLADEIICKSKESGKIPRNFNFVQSFKEMFEKDISDLNKKKFPFDLNFLKKLIINQSEFEVEAYNAGVYFAKKILRQNDYDSIVWSKVHKDLITAINTAKVK